MFSHHAAIAVARSYSLDDTQIAALFAGLEKAGKVRPDGYIGMSDFSKAIRKMRRHENARRSA